ncbi:MMS19 nucleotide excision repair protein homolog isoform X2 [Athalia rosae]|uniref:MMS19 nucleotide excision repair protein homolog isoform X2 n=1 Tax=Athalia rosae TaxID=37344 RepID=UPI0020349147|nr:MMS19 nucleotide excision repair protein homolog isoform X2 [Athalia rosae]
MEVSTGSSLVEKLTTAFKNDNDLIKECQDIASDIEKGEIKLLAFVEELGPFLTDKNVTSRAQGTLALSTTLMQLPKNFLNETELNFVTTFLCDRMKDNFEVIPAVLQGVLAIVQMSHLPQDSPSRLFSVMFQHIHCQSQLQPNRRIIYLIFQTLLETRADDLRSMGPDFIYGVISAMDGERDPRNLMLLFKILPKFIKGFPLGHLTEEMFEVIACYFPIDFNASASEGGHAVTREDLAYSLAPCLYAIPEFAEFCLPLIIERLDSSLKLAKLDSLYLLRNGAFTFGPTRLQPHLDELWPVLRKEVYPGGDIEMRNAGLETITELVKVLSKDNVIQGRFVEKVITDTKSSLCDVQLSLFCPAEKLLEAVARADKNACSQVLKTFVPLCLGQYSTKTSYVDRVILTESLNNLLAICEEHEFTIKNVPELAWADVPMLYLNALNTDNKELKLKTISGLTILKSSLNDAARQVLYTKICENVNAEENELKNVCHLCLVSFAKIYPKEIFGAVMEHLAIDDANIDTTTLTRRLEALCAIAKLPELGPEVLQNVVSIATSDKLEKSIAALSCLRKVVAFKSNSFNVQNFLYKDCNIIDVLVSTDTNGSFKKLSLIASICRSIVRKLEVKDQQIIVNKYARLLSESLSENNVVLLDGLLSGLQRNVNIENTVNLLKNLSHLAISGSNLSSKQISSKLISVLINKQNEDENLRLILNMLRERIKSILASDDSNISPKESVIVLNTWLTKALVVRGSQNSQDYLDFHINLLKDMEVGHIVADGFKTLSDRFEDTLSEDNYCNVKLFYKQRIFQNTIQKNHDFHGPARQNYLVALMHLVDEVPMELILMHLEQKIRTAALECLLCYAFYPTVLILPFKMDVLEQLADAIDDKKRLVRSIAVKTRTRWYLVGSPGEPK